MAMAFYLVSVALILLLGYALLHQHKKIKQWQQQQLHETTVREQAIATENKLHHEVTQLQNKLQHALQDPVTHLLGWQLFEDRLKQNIKESARYQFTMGLLLVDIDAFKVINDGLGYQVGDALLLEIAKRLETCIRQVDSLTRLNKDTFVVLLTKLAKPETAAVVAQRILQAFVDPFQLAEQELFITACAGIAIYPADGEDVATLLQNADDALQTAKQHGKHVYQFYQEKINTDSQRELALHNSLGRDTVFDELVIYYKPIINVQSNAVFAMDVLLSWQHPRFGLITSQELFSYAERQRKLDGITEWLITTAMRQFQQWHSLGFCPEVLSIPVLVSQLVNSHFIYRLSQLLQEVHFEPSQLMLTIKEASITSEPDALKKAFNMLNYLGVKLAIDHFGAAAFSLRQLQQLTVNYLRVDALLTADIVASPQTVGLMEALQLLAKNLRIALIVDEVSSEQEIVILQKLGCSLLQGSYFGTALSAKEVTDQRTQHA